MLEAKIMKLFIGRMGLIGLVFGWGCWLSAATAYLQTPLRNAVLVTPLNANGMAITNVGSLVGVNGLPITGGGGNSNALTSYQYFLLTNALQGVINGGTFGTNGTVNISNGVLRVSFPAVAAATGGGGGASLWSYGPGDFIYPNGTTGTNNGWVNNGSFIYPQ
jgi:hypothetical protein